MASDTSAEEVPSFMNFDENARTRARECPDHVVLSYTRADSDDSFDDFTWGRLERITRAAAHTYVQSFTQLGDAYYGEARRTATPDGLVVGLVGPSGPEHNLSFLALQRLGHAAMLISPRLADQGLAHLIRQMECGIVIAAPGPALDALRRVRDKLGVDVGVVPMIDFDSMLRLEAEAKAQPSAFAIPELQTPDPMIIMHTGGTTGLPKPVCWRHHWNSGVIAGNNTTMLKPISPVLATLPIFHAFGMGELLQALLRNAALTMLTASRPVTVAAVCAALDAKKCRKLTTVPYVLKLFADVPDSLAWLSRLEVVMAAGSATPNDLGTLLVRTGVKLATIYGQTESGILMSLAPDGDDWNWLRPLEHVVPHILFEPVPDRGEDLYHLICRPTLRSLVMSDRPDGSYGTKDLFRRHPTDPTRWRFVTRYDDIIVLVNGEKADPHPLEQAVSRNPFVQAALAFGAGRDALGLIVIASQQAAGLSREELVQRILPNLEAGNAQVPAYAHVSPDALIIKPPGTPFPMTDKATVIRPRFISAFAADIEEFYAARERAQQAQLQQQGGASELSDDEVRDAVRQIVRQQLRFQDGEGGFADDTDFFSAGMDSLLATNVRARIIRTIPLGAGRKLATNVAFDHPTVEQLTKHVLDVRKGIASNGTDAAATLQGRLAQSRSVEALAGDLVKKYTNFTIVKGTKPAPQTGFVVILTGATGFIGRQIVQALVRRESVATVYCLVRADSHTTAGKRVANALDDTKLLSALSEAERGKIVGLASDLSAPDLGLPAADLERLRTTTTHVIHNAWSVNFNMALPSFERHSIAGTFHLLNLAFSSPYTPKPAFTFVSSVAAAVLARPLPIREARHPWSAVAPQGYGQSKWVAEEMCTVACAAAAKHGEKLQCRIARASQISGDTLAGQWNTNEAVPRTVQTALTIGALPALEKGNPIDTCLWLPADVTGATIAELALLDGGAAGADPKQLPDLSVFHVESSQPISWTAQVLPALAKRGLRFETVDRHEWVHRLEGSNPDVRRNPPYRLLEHYKMRYGGDAAQGQTAPADGEATGFLDLTQALKYAPSLARAPPIDADLIGRYLNYWLKMWADEQAAVDKTANGVTQNGSAPN